MHVWRLHIALLLQVQLAHSQASLPKYEASLLQRLSRQSGVQISNTMAAGRDNIMSTATRTTCSSLTNHGTHFTVSIEVGTPIGEAKRQYFDVVADTGSDAIIVPSCACRKAGYCDKENRCFRGTERSSTFSIEDSNAGPPTLTMMFGSGPVQAVVATDDVTVGTLRTRMKDGVLLMTDHQLNIQGKFEGILGLGIPSSSAASMRTSKSGLYRKPFTSTFLDYKDQNKTIFTGGATVYSLGKPLPAQHAALAPFGANPFWSFPGINPQNTTEVLTAPEDLEERQERPETIQNGTEIMVNGFLEVAGISRFSICFNNGAPGVLRLGTPIQEKRHGSIGHIHWGLDFRGISVGNESAPVKFCRPEDMKAGQKTPCGGIPDSGTTAIMAPTDHLTALYESLCDEWPRCAQNFSAMQDPTNVASKHMIFQRLLFDCKNWLQPSIGLNELPSIHIHIAGSGGTKETLNVSGWAWVIETHEKDFKYIYKNIPGAGRVTVGKNYTGAAQKVCSPAFSAMDYTTEENGPVWILGTPIFYQYQVHYDMQSDPPGIAFSDTPCGSCDAQGNEQTINLMSHSDSATTRTISTASNSMQIQPLDSQLRQADGPWREPRLDFSEPL